MTDTTTMTVIIGVVQKDSSFLDSSTSSTVSSDYNINIRIFKPDRL